MASKDRKVIVREVFRIINNLRFTMDNNSKPDNNKSFISRWGLEDFRDKKLLLSALVFILLVLGTAVGVRIWQRVTTPTEEELKKQVEKQFEGKIREVEELIAAAERRIQELSEVTPEEEEKRKEERDILSAQKVFEDVGVEGVEVEVIEDENKKIIRNSHQGYSIEVPLNLVVARSVSSDWIELHDKEFMCEADPSCDPIIRIRALDRNPNTLSIGEWLKSEEKTGEQIYSPREELTIGGQTVYKVTESIPRIFDGFYYYWAKGTKIYFIRIWSFDDPLYRPYIETLRVE